MVASANVWVKFFQAAGVPNAAAASYAHIFHENRIELDMLMDLNKEYLREMGITPMGDIIAILRHSKKVSEQNAREKILASEKLSVATMSVSPLVPSVASTETVKSKKLEATSIVKPARRVLPEHEGKYKITLPAGTTERSKQILAKRAQLDSDSVELVPRKRIFDRLEAEPKVQLTGFGKPMSSSIFSRLGGKSTTTDEELEEKALAFAGILKSTDKKPIGIKKTTQQKVIMVKKIPAKAATMVADEYELRMETGEKTVSFSPEDEILEIEPRQTLARKMKQKGQNIRARLGLTQRATTSQSSLHQTRKIIKLKSSNGSPIASAGLKSDQTAGSKSIKSRLSLKNSLKGPEVKKLVNQIGRVSLANRLGAKKTKPIVNEKPASASSSSVFDRLGYNKKK